MQFGWCQVTKIESRRPYQQAKSWVNCHRGSVVSSAPFHVTQRTVRTKRYESAGGILIWLVALGSTPHRLIWTLFAGVMGFFVGGSFLAALQTPLSTNGAARQTTQTDTSEPILSRPVDPPPISAPTRPRNKHKRVLPVAVFDGRRSVRFLDRPRLRESALIARETSPLGHRLGLTSLMDGAAPPPFQFAPLSSSRPKQLG